MTPNESCKPNPLLLAILPFPIRRLRVGSIRVSGFNMSMSGSLTTVAAVIALALPVTCEAGRPVIHNRSLHQLTRTSEVIAVVARATTQTTVKRAHECESIEWTLSVVAIIKPGPGAEINPGSTIGVRQNVTGYQDCVYRKGWSTTGASFAANWYTPSTPDAPQHERFIVFLEPGDSGFQLVAESAFESIAKQAEVETFLAEQQTTVPNNSLQPIARTDRAAAER